jgi:septal ring-binding cell division protein DamX
LARLRYQLRLPPSRGQLIALLALVACLLPFRTSGAESLVTVPVQLDYVLLRQVLVMQLFNSPDQSRELLNDPTGCSQIVVSNPQVSPRGAALEIVAQVRAKLAVGMGGVCSEVLAWQGGVGLLGRPLIESGATSVRLEPEATWLIGADGKQINSGRLQELADASLKSLIRRFSLDFAPYVESLGSFLPGVLPRYSVLQLQAIIDSMRLNSIDVTTDSVDVALDFTVPESPASLPAATALTPEELQALETRWQMMDALLVYAVKRYAAATSLAELRSALLEVLIDSRYRLRDALAGSSGQTADQVRDWFLQSWQHLSPIIRRIGSEQEGQEHLLWFTVLTASDALAALDQLGPSIGLDISEDGLRRLARMINDDRGEVLLRYNEEVDPELQRLFREQLQPEAAEPSAWRIDLSLFPRAMAAGPADRLNSWAPGRDDLGEYLPVVAQLLDASADKVLGKYPLDPAHDRLFRKMVLTTAWQESCWRQYVVKSDKLEPLRSGSGDVGLMQVNERVWRGIYDLQKLRWDIVYNSEAGAEVLLDYLVKYALKKGEQKRPGGLNNLARASYSAYNGGPSQVTRYRRADVAPEWKKVDAAFWGKFQHVDAGNALKVVECLGGDFSQFGNSAKATAKTTTKTAAATRAEPARPVARPAEPVAKTTVAGSISTAESWLRAQPADYYTLQAGAFSEEEFATRFIVEERLTAPVHVVPVSRGSQRQFVVLAGSFASRADAEALQRKLGHLKPWLRQFADLQGIAGH